MWDEYVLNRDKSKYKQLERDLKRAREIMWDSSFYDNVNAASRNLDKNYIVNGESKYSNRIISIKSGVSDDIRSIGDIIDGVNTKIDKIDNDIERLNREQD